MPSISRIINDVRAVTSIVWVLLFPYQDLVFKAITGRIPIVISPILYCPDILSSSFFIPDESFIRLP
ncbi:hypothetical protein Mpet_2642 [Methanolacinia petrolearia DSM 11571]|uniref:Uncharacterized protein n=1 Tax=Methanolacinia petrolearia (strain DSM 11571 / OCM 486 / SEBR 4847) TaxID=679926 RepID=E1RG71_METP4|nr:hypothetical protein Mpet_2642 [Methanolacinia petrolearia DSM 11571]